MIIILLLVFVSLCEEVADSGIPFSKRSEICLDDIADGDILFRQGVGLESEIVTSCNNTAAYSHVGIAININSQMMAVHAIPADNGIDYIKVEPLCEFYSSDKAVSGAIGRVPLTSEERLCIRETVQDLIQKRVPFDHDYDISKHDKIYCSELIWLAYKSINLDISSGKRKYVRFAWINAYIIMPEHIYDHKDLEVILSF